MKRKRPVTKKNGNDGLLQTLSAAVSPETLRRLEEIAKAEDRTRSQLVRIALDEYVARRESAA